MVNNYNSCCSAYAEVLPHKVNTTPPNKVFQAAPEGKTPPPYLLLVTPPKTFSTFRLSITLRY